jgi:glycosyltransferase involved in cell wall biosynthesis
VKIRDVAVVIPFYNGSRYVERAIQSALGQTLKAAEVIIVDDGSSAEEARLLAEIAAKYSVRILTKENGGQGSARNLGIRHANAPYICLLDQDDYFLPWHIEHLVNIANERGDAKFAFAYGDLWRGDEDGRVLYHSWIEDHSVHPKTNLFMQLKKDMFILPSASLLAKESVLALGGFDETLKGYEDDDLFIRLFAAGYTSVYDPRPVTFWTINESSTTFSIKFSRSRWAYFEKLLKTFPDRPISQEFILRDCLRPRFLGHFVDDYLKSCFLKDEYLHENRQRLVTFLNYLRADPACGGLHRDKIILGRLVRLSPPAVVAWGSILASPFGGFLGRIGRRSMRPRLKELLWLRKHANQG